MTVRVGILILLSSMLVPVRGQPEVEPQGNCRITTTPAIIGSTMDFTVQAAAGAGFLVAVDLAPGSVPVGFGTVHLGLTPLVFFPLSTFAGTAPSVPASGSLTLPIPIAGTDGTQIYVQAAATDGPGFALSNARSILFGNPDSYHAPANAMTQPRGFHRTVQLLNGASLVIGGGAGAFLSPVATTACDRYNPYLRTFSPDTAMSNPRTLHTATTLLDGRVLVSGGSITGGAGLGDTEIYDPTTQTWIPGPALATNRIVHTATRLDDGRVLLTGGTLTFNIPVGSTNYLPIFQGSLDTAEIFDPATGQLTPTANVMSSRRFGHAAVKLLDGRVLISGGVRDGQTVFGISAPLYAQSADLFDPATNAFTAVPGFAAGGGGRAVHTLNLRSDGKPIAIGGAGGTLVATVGTSEVFDPATATWSAGPPLPGGATVGLHATATMPDGSLYVTGGAVGAVGSFSAIATAYRYTIASGIVALGSLPGPRQALTAQWTPEGVLIVGGGAGGSGGTTVDTAELWTPPFLARPCWAWLPLLVTMVLSSSTPGQRGGSFIASDARAAGRGGTDVGVAEDLSALLSNPAGLTLSEGPWRVDFTARAFFFESEYEDPFNPDGTSHDDTAFAPYLSLSWDPNPGDTGRTGDWRLALGVQHVAGFRGDLTLSTQDFLPPLQTSRKTDYIYTGLHLGAAYQLSDEFSLGATLSLTYSDLDVTEPLEVDIFQFQGMSPLGTPWGELLNQEFGIESLRIEGAFDSEPTYGFSVTLGALWRPTENVRFGISWRSPGFQQDYEGDVEVDISRIFGEPDPVTFPDGFAVNYRGTIEDFDYPQSFALGASWKPLPELRIAVELRWTNWSATHRRLRIRLSDGDNPGFNAFVGSDGLDITQNFLWRDQVSGSLGAEWFFAERWTLRAGGVFQSSPVRAESANPNAPAWAEFAFTAGIGYRADSWSADLAWIHVFPETIRVNDSVVSSDLDNSKQKIATDAILLSISFYF